MAISIGSTPSCARGLLSARRNVALKSPARSLVEDAAPVAAGELAGAEVAGAFHNRRHEEWVDGRLFSFFAPDGAHNRHVVLGGKERRVARRHGTLLAKRPSHAPRRRHLVRDGVDAWRLRRPAHDRQHLVPQALFGFARPLQHHAGKRPRILVEIDGAWRLLAVPSAFEMGLSDCRWIYRLDDREVTIHAMASGEHAAMQWRIEVMGKPCRFLVYGHLVLGERELEHASRVAIDAARKRFSFRPDPDWLWGQRYPEAVYHLVTATPDEIEAVGGDELLYADGDCAKRRLHRSSNAADDRASALPSSAR